MPPLGAHISVAGGLPTAFDRAATLEVEALQIFVKSPNRWAGRELLDDECEAFRSARNAAGRPPVVAHAAYLINLAAPDPVVLEKSRRGLADELDRCRRLGVDALVVHPGAHLGTGEEAALELIAASITDVLSRTPTGSTRLLLEVTAGQGTVVGYRLEHLARIRELSPNASEIGVCLDTCHLLAAGYDVDTPDGVVRVLARTIELFGPDGPRAVHVNDSQYPRGSRRDRHANLGDGHIPLDAFAALLKNTAEHVPLLLETPSGENEEGHRRDLEVLRRLRLEARKRDGSTA